MTLQSVETQLLKLFISAAVKMQQANTMQLRKTQNLAVDDVF